MTVAPIIPPVPVPLPEPASKLKGILLRAWAGFLTAITSASAVKAEKNLAVTVITGVLVAVGATDGLVQLVTSIINAA